MSFERSDNSVGDKWQLGGQGDFWISGSHTTGPKLRDFQTLVRVVSRTDHL